MCTIIIVTKSKYCKQDYLAGYLCDFSYLHEFVSLFGLFHLIWSYFISFHFILFYSILFYSILFYSILFYSILFYSIWSDLIWFDLIWFDLIYFFFFFYLFGIWKSTCWNSIMDTNMFLFLFFFFSLYRKWSGMQIYIYKLIIIITFQLYIEFKGPQLGAFCP